jgi:hypothetical protein
MYFPYLRGRQFELIAIRELVEKSLMSNAITPIIEPVKLSSALIKTMNVFEKNKRELGLVYNPLVGSLRKDLVDEKNAKNKEKFYKLLSNLYLLKVLYVDANVANTYSRIEHNGVSKTSIATICSNQDAIPYFESQFNSEHPRYNFIPDESIFRRRMPKQKILFEDRFRKKNRNVDYADLVDEPFSSDHIYYLQDGYIGFSDYSVIGDDYSETGFAPYAVAIHIVYFDLENNLRIRHFVSKTNDDITDPAGKFSEALEKLVQWNKTQRLNTYGIRSFENMYDSHSYPGLGTVKKLSIMHHLELMSRYLDGVSIE